MISGTIISYLNKVAAELTLALPNIGKASGDAKYNSKLIIQM
jgi:hypothetical protein